jgi:hypothetical protein
VAGARFWKSWLPQPRASVDTVGRVHSLLEVEGLRSGLHHLYTRLKRNKVLPAVGGLAVAVIDGHESHASYRRHCSGCLQRTIHTEHGDRLQYYHRQVVLMLVAGERAGQPALRLLLDLEPQRLGEDEVAAAVLAPGSGSRQRRPLARALHSAVSADRAMVAFLLTAFLAYNLFHAFLLLNPKPSAATANRRSSGPA